jgi:hypothetical protein
MMKLMSTKAKIFMTVFCSALCLAAMVFMFQPKAFGKVYIITEEEMTKEATDLTSEKEMSEEEKTASNIVDHLYSMREAAYGMMIHMRQVAFSSGKKVDYNDITPYALQKYKEDSIEKYKKSFGRLSSDMEKYLSGDNPIFQDIENTICKYNEDSKILWIGYHLGNAKLDSDGVKKHLIERSERARVMRYKFYGAMDAGITYTDQDIVWINTD